MVSEEQVRWFDRPLNATIVGGVVVLAIGWGVPEAISQATTLNVPAWVYVVVVLAAVILMSAVIPFLRRQTWGRLATWRPLTTSTAINGQVDFAHDAGFRSGVASANEETKTLLANQLIKHREEQLSSDMILAKQDAEIAAYKSELADRREALKVAQAEIDRLSEALASLPPTADDPLSQLPPPRPRWRLIPPSKRTDNFRDDGKFLLKNLIAGSVAKHVRLDNDGDGQFDFEDAAFWPDVSGEQTVTFAGEFARVDRAGDVLLKLTYLDHEGRECRTRYWLNVDGTVNEINENGPLSI